MADTIDNVKIYKKVSRTGAVADQYVVVNLDATNFYVTLNATHTLAEEFSNVWDSIGNLNNGVIWKADVSTIGTTAVSTKNISTNSASIASGNTDLVTGGAIYSYVNTEGGKIKEIRINGATQTISAGVVNLPAYPVVSNSTITIQQAGINDQTFTLNGNAATITLVDTNTWRPLGTGASDAAAGNHNHDSVYAKYTTKSVRAPSAATENGFWYVRSDTASLSGADSNPLKQYHTNSTDFRILTTAYDSNWFQQLATDFYSNNIYFRRKQSDTWHNWVRIALSGEAQPASDVYSWAKAVNKPTYTAAEVGALPDSTTYLKSISKSGSTYTITDSDSGATTWTIPTIPSNISAFNNDAGYLTTVAWGDVTGKPSTFTPSAHTHTVTDVTDISSIGTTAVSTVTISTSSADIAAGNSKLVTGGAIADALANVSYKPTVVNDTIIFN